MGAQPGPRYARSPARTARRRDRLVEPQRRISCFQEGREFGQDLSTGHGRITEAGINDTGVDRLPPKNAMLQLARLSVALQQPWLWCMGAATRRYDELSEPCNVDQCVSITNCWSTQPALRNVGRLVRMDPSLGMAEFIGEVCHRCRPKGPHLCELRFRQILSVFRNGSGTTTS